MVLEIIAVIGVVATAQIALREYEKWQKENDKNEYLKKKLSEGQNLIDATPRKKCTRLHEYQARYKPKPVLTEIEQIAYQRICRAVPEYIVFGQTAFTAMIEPDHHRIDKKWYSLFGRIAQKRCDFVVMDRAFKPVCIVEIDDRTHNKEKDAERDSYTESAGIITHRWQATYLPSSDDIRAAILTTE